MSEPTPPKKTVEFLGVVIETGPGALIPRAETELLGRTAVAKLGKGRTIVDVCCGTANLACAIATLIDDVRGWALDLTDGAVALARSNVDRLALRDRITVAQGDLFAPLDESMRGTVDVVVCNPPYISTAKLATRADLADEPREAFDGGPYGVTIHQRVAREAVSLLRPGGWLVMEHGVGQDRQVKIAIERARGYDEIEIVADDQGAPRVIAARRSSTPHEQ
jgi:release factor glutamine methyltransferase